MDATKKESISFYFSFKSKYALKFVKKKFYDCMVNICLHLTLFEGEPEEVDYRVGSSNRGKALGSPISILREVVDFKTNKQKQIILEYIAFLNAY